MNGKQIGFEIGLAACLGLILGGSAWQPVSASAANTREFDGAWSTSAAACSNMFVQREGQTYLSEKADFFGSGFVIDGNIIRGKIATCKITSVKKSGTALHLRTVCTTDITTINNSFDLRVIDANRVIRSRPDIPEMDTPYIRCSAN